MKRVFFSMAFLMALASAFAFKALPAKITAHYLNGPDCSNTKLTNEDDCITNSVKAQCTVTFNSTTLPAWNHSDCSQALRLP